MGVVQRNGGHVKLLYEFFTNGFIKIQHKNLVYEYYFIPTGYPKLKYYYIKLLKTHEISIIESSAA